MIFSLKKKVSFYFCFLWYIQYIYATSISRKSVPVFTILGVHIKVKSGRTGTKKSSQEMSVRKSLSKKSRLDCPILVSKG